MIHLLCIHKRISCVGPGPGTGPAPFLGPWPLGSLAQSMHKSVVHVQEISCYTQEILLCIHNKCINVTSVAMLRSYAKLCETMRNYAKLLQFSWDLTMHAFVFSSSGPLPTGVQDQSSLGGDSEATVGVAKVAQKIMAGVECSPMNQNKNKGTLCILHQAPSEMPLVVQ